MRKFVAAVFMLLVAVAVIIAAEAKGKVKKVEKGTVTVTVDGKDVEFKMGKGVKMYQGNNEVDAKDKEARQKFMKEQLKEGAEVTIEHENNQIKTIKVK